MLMKKVIVSVLSLLCAMFSIGSVSACDFNNSTVISEIKLGEKEKEILNQYNRVFLETGFIKEFQLERCKSIHLEPKIKHL